MTFLEKSVTARISKNHAHFEILVDPELALEFRKGKDIPVREILSVNEIFKDSRTGERASVKELEDAFGTSDTESVAVYIIKKGEIQLTTEQRRKLVEEKRNRIAYIISRHGIDPKTRLPHPASRILHAMEEAHVNIDPFKPAEEQAEGVIEKIRPLLPISIETLEIAIRVPIRYAGKASSVVRNMASLKKEEWKSDCWIAVIEIPAGMQSDVYSRLNDITSGSVEAKVMPRK